MAIPLQAPTMTRRMDPRDRLDVYVALNQGDALKDILQPGELVTSFQVSLTAEAIVAGMLLSGGADAPRYADRVFAFQLSISPAMRGSAIFLGSGMVVGVEVDFATNMVGREKQYTVGIKVVNK